MPTILYVVTEDWFFVSHFLPMARAAREAGFDVAVAANLGASAPRIIAEGFRAIPLDGKRKSLAPTRVLGELAQVRRIIRDERPDILHCIALRPVVLGGIAARMAGGATATGAGRGATGVVLALTGLGELWLRKGLPAAAIRSAVRFLVGGWLRTPATRYLFENEDDPRVFGLDPATVTIVHGAGVDPADFPNVPPPPAPPLKVAVVSRMIWSKGVGEAVAAAQRARALGAPIELHLFGAPDPGHGRSIPEATLRAWSAEPGIRWHGFSTDIPGVWREHHAALFLSQYREGLPRCLVEAAACGRPIVTTDTTGCRDIVRDGREGFLVPPGDIEAAARALVRLAGDPALRERLGAAANARFNTGFTEAAVKRTVGDLYRSMLAAAPAAARAAPSRSCSTP